MKNISANLRLYGLVSKMNSVVELIALARNDEIVLGLLCMVSVVAVTLLIAYISHDHVYKPQSTDSLQLRRKVQHCLSGIIMLALAQYLLVRIHILDLPTIDVKLMQYLDASTMQCFT